MTALRNLIVAAFLVIAATPAFAQVTGPAQQPSSGGQAIFNSNDYRKIGEDLLRWSIPSGDFIAQSIFSIVPAAGTTTLKQSELGQAMPVASAIGDIVGLINILIVGLGVLIGTTRIVEWVVNMGREGKWEAGEVNLWAPVRFAMAFFLILPIPNGNGFNIAQYAFGTIARAGYAAGSATWNYAVALSTTQGRASIVPAMSPKLPETVADIGFIELCRAAVDGYSYKNFGTPTSAAVANWVEEETANKIRWSIRFDGTKANAMGVGAIFLMNLIPTCGSIELDKGTDEKGQTSLFYRAHMPAVREARDAAMVMSNTVMTAWFKGGPGHELAIAAAIERYMSSAGRAYAARIANESAQILSQTIARSAAAGKTTAESQFAETAKYAGWSSAGAFYFSYGRVASSAAQVAGQLPEVNAPLWDRFRKLYGEGLYDSDIGPHGLVERYRKNIANYIDPSAPDWMRAGFGGQSGMPNSTDTTGDSSRIFGAGTVIPGATAINNFLMTTAQDVMRSFLDPSYRGANGFNPNVLQTQIEMGHRMMAVGTAMLMAAFVKEATIEAVADSAGGFLRQLPFAGSAISAAGGVLKGGLKFAFLNAIAVGSLLVGIGALWAYLLPLMLAFMWFAAVLGWLMLVVEALLVASLMGIANMTTGETTVLSQKSSYGLNVAFNLAFRPLLMIVGLIVSVMLYSLIASAASNGIFKYAVPSMLGDSLYGPIGFVLTLLALTVFNFSLLMWLGNMANTIAENVPTWLGMNAGPNYRSSEAVSQLNNLGTMAGAHQTAGALRGGALALSKMRTPASNPHETDKNDDKRKNGEKQTVPAETGLKMK